MIKDDILNIVIVINSTLFL